MSKSGVALGLLLGLTLGLGLGLFVAWGLLPPKHYEGPPSALKEPLKKDYVYLISAAYAQEGDLNKARERLRSLGYRDPAAVLAQTLAELKSKGAPRESLAALAVLAQALKAPIPAAETYLPSPTPTSTPQPLLPTPIPPTATPTPSPTPLPSFVLKAQEKECRPDGEPSLLEIEVLAKDGMPLPGIELIVSWEGGEEHIFTGLKPGKSPGYADFEMQPGATYRVRPAEEGSEEAANLLSSGGGCPPDKPRVSWRLTFQEAP
jgi:hypothetical protein